MSEPETAGRITAVEGLAAKIGLRPGDELLAVNGHPVRDLIDVQFYAAESDLELLIRRDGELWLYEAEREENLPLGLTFERPTFDVDIRRCNNRCPFCFVTQMAPRGFRRSLYVKDDDYRLSFLDGSYVTLTNLSQEDWERIEEQHLSPLYVSVHATDLALRRKLLGNPRAPDVMEQLRRLAAIGIEVHTQLVIVPGVNDGAWMERSVADLATLWPAVNTVSVVPVGLTRFHRHGLRPNTPAEAVAVLDAVEAWQVRYLADQGDRFLYATDEWYLLAGRPLPPLSHYRQLDALQENGVGLVRSFLDEWAKRKSQICKSTNGSPESWVDPVKRAAGHRGVRDSGVSPSITLVTGTLFAPVLSEVAAEYGELRGVRVEVRPVVNKTLGESITVAGLLMGADIIEALAGVDLGDRVLLPAAMFRGPGGVTLDDMRPDHIAAALGRPVGLAEGMEDLDASVLQDAGFSSPASSGD
jgi:putative radical SAM enzyme (TIGR03279 family)